MLHHIIKFIHDLRILLFAIILVSFMYNVGVDPIDVGRFIGAKLGRAIGISTSTSVPPNPFNSLALQLEEKKKFLDDKEDYLNQKEEEIYLKNVREQRRLIIILAAGLAVLLVLIAVNFYLDYKRKKKNPQ